MSIFFRRAASAIGCSARTYATVKPGGIRPRPAPGAVPDGPLRPHLNVKVNPNHGLYAFFRKRTDENSWKKPELNEFEHIAVELPLGVLSGG